MAKSPTLTASPAGAPGTLGEVAPAAERVILDAAGTALATSETGPVIDGTAQVGSLAAAAALLDAPAIPREVPGPGVGAERVAERIETVRDRPLLEERPRAPVWPATRLIDPARVPGRHPVDVATRVSHDGVDYAPDHPDPDRRTVLLTFKEYSELVAIGAVIPVDWPEVREDLGRPV